MSICIEKLSHGCGTRHGLQVFADEQTGKVSGFCFACGTYIHDPYGEPKTVDQVDLPPPPTEEEIAETIAEISGYPVVNIRERRLSAKDLGPMGVKVSMSEKDGKTPTAMYFPITKEGKVTGYYVKTLGKNSITYSIGDVRDGDLFNWSNANGSGSHTLIVTEGLPDAVAVKAIFRLKEENDKWIPAVVSLPNGTNSVKAITRVAKELAQFKRVIFCFDGDEPGKKALEQAMLAYPKGLTVSLPAKDANDCILEGKIDEAYRALSFMAKPPENTRLVTGTELHAIGRTPVQYGALTWPFPTMNKLLRNMRTGETSYCGAGVKMGKSELLNSIAAHNIMVDGVPVFMAKPEESNVKTYRMMAGKVVGKRFHDPDVEFDVEAYDRAGELLKDKLMVLDLYQHVGWKSLRQDIVHAASEGAKIAFIDPITNLVNGVNAGDANTELQAIAQEAAALSLDLDIHIMFFCHLKAWEGNIRQETRAKRYEQGQFVGLGACPHELGGDILSNQFTGSRAMMRSCNLMLGLEGNKDPDLDETNRNMRYINILEDREFGNRARIPIWWNSRTTMYKEV
jgi:twinkle protein